MKNLVGWTIAGQLFLASTALAQESPVPPQTVSQITTVTVTVHQSMPPRLELVAGGTVNSGGHTAPRLVRVRYRTPPEDGVQEFKLVTRPPSGPATTVMSEVQASDLWDTVVRDAPWIRGVRVLGEGDGTRQVMLDDEDRSLIASVRAFTGNSETGSYDEALQAALAQMNTAMASSRAVDGMATWHLGPVSGRVGGFAGFRDISVTIYAQRTPPWDEDPPVRLKPDRRR